MALSPCFEKHRQHIHKKCMHERILRETGSEVDFEAYYYCPKCNARFAVFIATELIRIEKFLNGNTLWKRIPGGS